MPPKLCPFWKIHSVVNDIKDFNKKNKDAWHHSLVALGNLNLGKKTALVILVYSFFEYNNIAFSICCMHGAIKKLQEQLKFFLLY